MEDELDPRDYLVRNPLATFYARATGSCMEGAGLRDGDVMVIDRSKRPSTGSIVIVIIDDVLCARRLTEIDGVPWLECVPENGDVVPDPLRADIDEIRYWGAVTGLMRRM